MNNYYVYIYFDPRKNGNFEYEDLVFTNEPFYVGKGKNKRLRVHINQDKHNKYKLNKIKAIKRDTGLEPIIKIFVSSLLEKDALENEMVLIKKIGRKDLNLGPLLNATDGGDGVTNPSLDYRFALSNRMKGEKNPNFKGKSITENHVSKQKKFGADNSFFNKTHTVETKQKLSFIRRNETNETKIKRVESFKITKKNNKEKWCKKYEFISPSGEFYFVNDGLTKFVNFHGLSEAVVNKICNNILYKPKSGSCVGWKIRRL